MKKLNTIKSSAMLLQMLPVENFSELHPVMINLGRGDVIGASMGLVNVLSGTKSLPFQKVVVKSVSKSRTFQWIGHAILTSLLLTISLITNAQTNWTPRFEQKLNDVAYGVGKYVAVGDLGIIRTGTGDAASWNIQVQPTTQAQGLSSVIFTNLGFVAVGNEGRIVTSTDGLTWTKRVSGTTKALTAVAFGNGRFVAVGLNGAMITSTNGISWSPVASANVNDHFYDLIFGAGQFIAVGKNGNIKMSANGLTWISSLSPLNSFDLNTVVLGKNNEFFVAGTKGMVLSSKNGASWTNHIVNGPKPNITGLSYNSVQDRYIGVSSESNQVIASKDGVNWTQYPTIVHSPLYAVRYLQGQFMAVGDGNAVFTIAEGNSLWKHITINKEIDLYGAAYGNGRYVAVGEFVADYNRSLAANAAVTSLDGINYSVGQTVNFAGGAKKFNAVAFGKGLFVAVGEDAVIETSTEGKVWASQKVVFGKTLKGIAFGNGWFVAVGLDNLVFRSLDGKNWMQNTTGFSMSSNGITYAQGKFTAVGIGGGIATSSDGLIWTNRKLNTPGQFKSVAYGNGMWIAVGYDGLVAWSVNGVNWYIYKFGWVAFNQIIFANGQFVAVANAAKIFTSPTGLAWTERQSKTNTYYHYNSIVYANNLFSAVGTQGAVATSLADSKSSSARLQLTEPTYSSETGELTLNTTGGDGTDIEFMALDSTRWTSAPVQMVDSKLHAENVNKPLILMARQGEEETYYVWDIAAISSPDRSAPVLTEQLETKTKFKAVAYPVPVEDQMTISIDDAAGQKVRIQLIDLHGRTVVDRTVEITESHYEETMSMGQRQTGLYVLRLATPKHMQSIKVLKR